MSTVFGRNSMQRHSVSQGLLSDMGPGMHPRVSILGGAFRLVDEAGQHYGAPCILRNVVRNNVREQKLAMLAIIIGSNPKRSRVFYDQPYDPDNPGPPDCFSDNGLAPSANASTPQARTCVECEWSKWGSDISVLTGKKIKACSEKRKIALLIVGDTTQRVYEMQIPPATLKNMAKYAALCASHSPPGESRKADVCDFVTAIQFVTGQTGVLEFEPYSWISSTWRDEAGTVMLSTTADGQPLDAPDQGQSVGDLIDEIWSGDSLPMLLGLNDTPWTPPPLTGPLPGMKGASEPVQHAIAHTPATTVPGAAPYAQEQPPPNGGVGGFQGSPFAPPPGRAQAQPVNPFASAQQSLPAPGANAPAPAAPQQQPPAAPARSTRGRKPRGEAGAAGAGGGAPAQAPFLPRAAAAAVAPGPASAGHVTEGAASGDIPDFLRRSGVSHDGRAGAGGPVDVAAGPGLQPGGRPTSDRATNESGAFGMVTADPPPNELAKTLGGVFALPVARQ